MAETAHQAHGLSCPLVALYGGVELFGCNISATTQEKLTFFNLAVNYLAFVKLACIRLWLRVYECTA